MLTHFIEASAGCGKTTFLLNQSGYNKALFITFSNAAADELRIRIAENEINKDAKISTLHSLAHEILFNNTDFNLSEASLKNEAIHLLLQNNDFFEIYDFVLKNTKKAADEEIEFEKIDEFEFFEDFSCKVENNFNLLTKTDLILQDQLDLLKDNFFTQQNTIRKKFKQNFDENTNQFLINRIKLHEKNLENYLKKAKNSLYIAIKQKEEELKKERNILYYEDLILNLIEKIKQNGEIVLKFFGEFDAIFIDEAQDLSQSQWELIYSILTEWNQLNKRILYISGDSKQLIYGFQGACVQKFFEYKEKIKKISAVFQEIKLNKSYRLSLEICEFLNKVGPKMNINYEKHVSFAAFNKDSKVEIIKISNLKDLIDKINCEKMSDVMFLFKNKSDSTEQLALFLIQNGYFLNSPYYNLMPIIKDFQHLINFLIYKDKLSEKIIKNITEFPEIFHSYLFDLDNLFSHWIKNEAVKNFLQKNLQDSVEFYIEILRKYANFYKYEPINAISDKKDFYKNNSILFKDGIFFNTIHSSKGKEAKTVFLINLDQKSRFEKDNRLLYVALTRAKEKIFITVKNEDNSNEWMSIIQNYCYN